MRIFEFVKAVLCALALLLTQQSNAAELLLVESAECPYCVRFHAEIGSAYPNTEEGKTAPLQSILLGQALPARYKNIEPATVTPTFILVHEGKEFDRLVGYPGDEHFWFLLNQMLDKLPKKTDS